MNRSVLAGLALLMFTHIQAHAAGLSVVSQNRTVSGTTTVSTPSGGGTDGGSATAPGAGAFQESRYGDIFVSDGVGSGGGWQDSWVLSHSLRGEATHFSNADVWGGSGWANASGSTLFDVTFEVFQSEGYSLTGFVEEFDNGSTRLTLDGPSGSVHAFYAPTNNTLNFSETGTLDPGQYRLIARSDGSSFASAGSFDYSSGAWEFELTLDSATDAPVVAGSLPAAQPNPFRLATRLTVPDGARSLDVFDAAGRLVKTLEGRGAVVWDGRGAAGQEVPAGVYFVRAEGTDRETVKLIRVR
ncbi:MAG TPA: FlgD immunoglobulin-like domain containing protein [bacterium]|nr:FlgD immunoglobulin-like domain containing protein [bacterium]